MFDLVVDVKNPNGIHVVVRIFEQLQGGESYLAIGVIPANNEKRSNLELGLGFCGVDLGNQG